MDALSSRQLIRIWDCRKMHCWVERWQELLSRWQNRTHAPTGWFLELLLVEPLLRQQSFCAISHLKRHETKSLYEHLGFGCVHHFVTSGSIMWLTIEAKLSAILWDTVYDGDQNAWSWNVNTCPSLDSCRKHDNTSTWIAILPIKS